MFASCLGSSQFLMKMEKKPWEKGERQKEAEMKKKGTLLGNINQAASVHMDRGRRAKESPSPFRKKAVKVSVLPTPSRGSGLSLSITREKIKLVLAKGFY